MYFKKFSTNSVKHQRSSQIEEANRFHSNKYTSTQK